MDSYTLESDDAALALLKQYVEDTLTCKVETLWGSMKCAIKPYIKKKVEVLEAELQLLNPLKRKVEEMGLKLDSLKEKLSKYEDTVSKMNEKIMSQEAEIAKLQYDISDIDQGSEHDEDDDEDGFDPDKFISNASQSISDIEVECWGDKAKLKVDDKLPIKKRSLSLKTKEQELSPKSRRERANANRPNPTSAAGKGKGKGGRPPGSCNKTESKDKLKKRLQQLEAKATKQGTKK